MLAIRSWLRWIRSLVSYVAVPFFGGFAKLSTLPTWWPANWSGFHGWVAGNQFWLLVVLPLLGGGVEAFERNLARREGSAQLYELLRKVLQRLVYGLVPDAAVGDSPIDHRLTLFRADMARGRLIIVARSSHVTGESVTSWRIDRNSLERCEGVAGVTWFRDCLLTVQDLPDVSNECADGEVEDYARRTFVRRSDVIEKRWRARSYAATTIRVAGEPWGVLVLDSIDPRGASDRIWARESFAVEMLGDIIQGWPNQ